MRKKAVLTIILIFVVSLSFIGYNQYQNWIAPIPELEPGDIVEINHPRIQITGKLILHNVWEFDRVYYFSDINKIITGSDSKTINPSWAIKKSSLLKWGYRKVGNQAVTQEDSKTYEEWQHMGKGQGTIPD